LTGQYKHAIIQTFCEQNMSLKMIVFNIEIVIYLT